MHIFLMVIAIGFLTLYFIKKVGFRRWAKAILCVMMVLTLGPLGLIFVYFFVKDDFKIEKK